MVESLGRDRRSSFIQRRSWPAALCLALALSACVSAESWEAVRVLKDIDAGAGPSALKATTPEPTRREIVIATAQGEISGDLYAPNQPIGARLVLVPGFTPRGKDDPRLVELANSLARARFLVLVPEIEGSRALRVRIDDRLGIAGAIQTLDAHGFAAPSGVGVIAISYSVALALTVALEPGVTEKIRFVVGIGGYHDTHAVIRFMTTGHYRAAPSAPWRIGQPHPSGRWVFLASHTGFLAEPADRARLEEIAARRRRAPAAAIEDLAAGLGPEAQALLDLLTATDPERIDALIAALSPAIRDHIAALSPARLALDRLAGRLILIHGEEDTLVPPTESAALARAAGRAELFLIPEFSHIDPRSVGLAGRLALIDAVQAVLARRS